MFKNATIYRISNVPEHEVIEAALGKDAFVACGPSQERSLGWVPPRSEHGAFVESVGGQWIARLLIETKSVPGSVLAERAKEKAQRVEQLTGRKPGKKEMREIKEDIRHELLPDAFPKRAAVTIWIEPLFGLLVIDTASQNVADTVATCLVKSVDGLALALVNTHVSPLAIMASWLLDGDKLDAHDRFGFDVGSSCELKAGDESKAVVRYQRHSLDTDDVKQHINQGKLPVRLELIYDDRVAFVLDDGGRLRKLQFLDVAFEGKDDMADAFDADTAILTGELSKVIDALIDALGGECE